MSAGRIEVIKIDEDQYSVLLYLSTVSGGATAQKSLGYQRLHRLLECFNICPKDVSEDKFEERWVGHFSNVEFEVVRAEFSL